MLISDAYADAPVASAATATVAPATPATVVPDAPSPLSGMGILLFIPLVLYIMLIRPNQKKIRQYEDMLKTLKRGDRIVTGGGIVGVIQKIEGDDMLVVEIAPDVKVRVMRDTISNVVTRTAVNDNKVGDAAKKTDDKALS